MNKRQTVLNRLQEEMMAKRKRKQKGQDQQEIWFRSA